MAIIFETPLDFSQSAKKEKPEMQADPRQNAAPSETTEANRVGGGPVANPAFAILEELVGSKLNNLGLDKERIRNLLIASWALVHGLSNIVCTKEINDKLRAEGRVVDRIRASFLHKGHIYINVHGLKILSPSQGGETFTGYL